MSKGLNKVQLIGYLGATPEMRYTEHGVAVTSFRLAVGRTWKDAEGATHDETEWFRIVAWGQLAETCNQYLDTGRRVYVEGRLQTRAWTDQKGQKRSTTEVVAGEVIFVDGPQSEAGGDEAPAPPQRPRQANANGASPTRTSKDRTNGAAGTRPSRRVGATRSAVSRAPARSQEQRTAPFPEEDLPF